MSVDRTKILEAAQKHLAKGANDKAIVEFQKLVAADPTDVRTWLKIGDLQSKIGKQKDAVDTYTRVADQYANQGFFLKAVAVHKQILKLDPARLDVQLKLAKAYESLQLVSDAIATYEAVAGSQARGGDLASAVATLGRMVELDPESIPNRIKHAEALSRLGRTKEAAEAFEGGAKLLKAQGRLDDHAKVAERLLYHRPDDVPLSRELAGYYLGKDDAKRALAKLQVAFKADPKHVETLEMLATAFEKLGQLPKTISVHREIARLYGEAGKQAERAATLKRILELDPGDAEARQALAAFAAAPKPAATAAPVQRDLAPPPGAVIEPSGRRAVSEPAMADDVEEIDEDDAVEEVEDEPEIGEGGDIESAELSEEELAAIRAAEAEEAAEAEATAAALADPDAEDIVIVDEEPESAPPPAAHAPSTGHSMQSAIEAARPSLPPEVAREAQIAKLLTECDVFLRYGLKQKVVEQLRRVLEIQPTHVEAREKLKDVLVDRGETAAAAAELIVLADLFTAEKPAVALLYARQAQELDPGNAEAQSRLAALSGDVGGPSTEPPTAELPRQDDHSMATDAGVLELEEPPPPSARQAIAPPPSDEANAPLPARSAPIPSGRPLVPRPSLLPRSEVPPAAASEAPPGPEGEVFFVEDDSTTGSLGRPPAATPVPPAAAPRRAGDPLAPMSPAEFENLRPSAPPGLDRVSRPSLPPGEVEELLDESEFFVAQGLFDEALAMLRDAARQHPRNILIRDKIAEVEEQAAQVAASAPAPPPEVDRSFELAEKLADDLGPAEEGGGGGELDVEQVFAQFKKGVEQQVGLEDTETHFDLGIAYKEMGLIPDAIAEFELCLKNPTRVCIAHTMIGICLVEKGDLPAAIAQFKKGLYADQKTDREELGLYYEIGRAYELMRDPKEALYYFEKVKKRDPSFRNVQDRLNALQKPPPAAPAAPAAGSDDIDAAFDDLMGKE